MQIAEAVSVWPNDTIVSATSGALLGPRDLMLTPAGVVLVRDGEDDAVVRIDPATLGTPLSRDTSAVWEGRESDAGVVAADLGGGRWLFVDSIPRLQRYDASDRLISEHPVSAAELTAIRVNQLYRARIGELEGPVRYATDLQRVGDALWLLLNTTAQGGGVVVVFNTDGSARGKLILNATEGGRRFAFDPQRATLYLITPDPPQLLSVDLTGHESLWDRPN